MTEFEKMSQGKIYDTSEENLVNTRVNAHKLCKYYNDTTEVEEEKRLKIVKELIPTIPETAFLQGPIYFDYGVNTKIGKNFYGNFNLTILDCATVTIGDDVLIGPNVSIVTPVHPLRYQDRNIRQKADGTLFDYEYAKPIKIGSNCWIASNVTIIGGVTIGDGCVIGAGSVVTKDIPNNSLAVGNPCKVIREITEKDSLKNHPELY